MEDQKPEQPTAEDLSEQIEKLTRLIADHRPSVESSIQAAEEFRRRQLSAGVTISLIEAEAVVRVFETINGMDPHHVSVVVGILLMDVARLREDSATLAAVIEAMKVKS